MKKDVIIGYPCYDGKAEVQAMQTMMQCYFHPETPVAGIQYLNGDSLVTRARNRIVHKFLKTTMEYLLFIDNDIIFAPKDILNLRHREKDIIGGVYFKKDLPYKPVANRQLSQDGDLFEMAEIGTGFMMIRRNVFLKIQEMFPDHFYKNEGDETEGQYYDYFRVGVFDGRYLSEDYYFCQLARKAGFKVWLDGTVLVKHIGRGEYPFPDDKYLWGAADLLMKYNPSEPLDMKILDAIEEGVNYQRENR